MAFSHIPVLLQEVLDGLNIREDGFYADGTLGGGGHAQAVLERLGPDGHYLGVDQDGAAIAAATERLAPYADRLTVIRANYEELPRLIREAAPQGADGILLDLGVSSYQLDSPERGFTYREDAPLDMRMDQRQDLTAEIIVNTYSEEELTRILYTFGEERYARNIARRIVREREKTLVRTTGQLTDLIRASIPARTQAGEGHPAKRSFQALRIATNRELTVLENSVEALIDALAPGGRLCIITFHSLEDRIVKNAFRTAWQPCTCPPSFPVCICGKKSKGTVITRRPVTASEEEQANNPRSKSAKLRVFERTEESVIG